MKANRTKELRRSMRYTRGMRGKRAVSPVVATLILILIAVAAAAALYLWLVAWQGGVTKGIGAPSAQYTITIGGSSSVYPWSVVAANSFEANNSNIVISINQGGSGAGDAAVCAGQVDIGASSAPVVASTLESNDGCPSTVVQETVAYDAVDVIVPTANPHGLSNISWDTMQSIYIAGVGGFSGLIATTNLLTAYSMNGVPAGQTVASSGFTWSQIPACVATAFNVLNSWACAGGLTETGVAEPTTAIAFNSGTEANSQSTISTAAATITGSAVYTVGASYAGLPATAPLGAPTTPTYTGTLAACTFATPTVTGISLAGSGSSAALTVSFSDTLTTCTGSGTIASLGGGLALTDTTPAYGTGTPTACGNDQCFTPGIGAQSPCGWTVCAGGANTIHPWQRSDTSGTTQSFTSRILAVKASGNAPSGIGFTGCGTGGQLVECGISEAKQGFGNPGVIAGVKGDPDGIGYASDGLVIAAGSGVVPVGLQGYGQTNAVFPSVSKGTIINGIVSGTTGVFTSSTYVGWRPFVYIQEAPPTGEVLRYLEWCFQPGNNQLFATQSDELSPYQPGLAGVVPVTPIP